MKCPYCGKKCKAGALFCDSCKQPLSPDASQEKAAKRPKKPKTPLQKIFIALCWLACFVALAIGIYKLVYTVDSYRIRRLYSEGGKYEPTVNTVEMDDGLMAHALVFYGNDGDMVYLPELNQCLPICGGTARVEIADAEWFNEDVSEFDYADVSFAPILMKSSGEQVRLPVLEYTVDVPEAPLKVLSPAKENLETVTSTYPLELQVVPGSELFINGEDVTDRVERGGELEVKVSVQPIGDNTYTVIVRTPHHKETRKDIVIYRKAYDIEIELDQDVAVSSTETTMLISGTCEPGAMISVDTDYQADSLTIDMTTGKFSFLAKFSKFGENIVRFRAQMEGREDAVVSLSINYKPTLAQYSAKAWAMDYRQLNLLYEQWNGRVFLCKGMIVDTYIENDIQYMVMDVGTNGETQLVLLQNYTSTQSPSYGVVYRAYADVVGKEMYQTDRYPVLAARYMDVENSTK